MIDVHPRASWTSFEGLEGVEDLALVILLLEIIYESGQSSPHFLVLIGNPSNMVFEVERPKDSRLSFKITRE